MNVVFALLVIFDLYLAWRAIKENYYCNLLCSTNNAIARFSKYKWLGFSNSMRKYEALSWAVRVGLISKLERNRLGNGEFISMKGCWFNNVEEIGFRFGVLSGQLYEIRLIYDCSLINDSDEKQYERLVDEINKSRNGKWEDIGIQLLQYPKEGSKIVVTMFLTKVKHPF